MAQQIAQRQRGESKLPSTRLDVSDGRRETVGFWLRSDEACVYVGCKTLKGWYMWRVRHGIATDNRGRVSRRDLDQALRRPRKRRAMSPVSLANLRLRHAAQDAANTAEVVTSER